MYCILQPTAVSHLCTGWVWEGQVASGVSQGNLIQAGFETFFSSLQKINAASVGVEKKQTQKPPFPLVLELEARHCIMLGALGSQVCGHQEVRQFGPPQCEAA